MTKIANNISKKNAFWMGFFVSFMLTSLIFGCIIDKKMVPISLLKEGYLYIDGYHYNINKLEDDLN